MEPIEPRPTTSSSSTLYTNVNSARGTMADNTTTATTVLPSQKHQPMDLTTADNPIIPMTDAERALVAQVHGLSEAYTQLLQKQQHIYPVLLGALAELSLQRSSTDQLLAPAVYALPVVPKKVEIGPRGGMRYINAKGNIIWLKKSQKQKCKNGTLEGSGTTCPAPGK